ncbi:MAG: C10 family peptidase, partial [Tenacibaculum sp.]
MGNKLTFLAVFFYSLLSFSNTITKQQAIKTANNWLATSFERGNQRSSKNIKQIQEIKNDNNQTLLYLIEYVSGGFIIISGDDNAKPVLAFSENGLLPSSTENPYFEDLITTYSSHVLNSINNPKSSKREASEWKKINNSYTYRIKNEVEPLTSHIKFGQSNGFNKLCPEDTEGPGGNALVGCVATAMSQIMAYWEFPTNPRGQHSYNHEEYGPLSVDFNDISYDWNTMSKTSADYENQELSHHAGVTINMQYSATSSGAFSRDVPNAMRSYFKFDNDVRMVYKFFYQDTEWNEILKNELSEDRPILYSGRSDKTTPAGHLFILDGYKTTEEGDYFHLNWGWGGKSNGYFYLDNLTTHNGDHNWVKGNSAIINLKPSNIAPVFTSINTIETITEGNSFQYTINTFDENRQDNPIVSIINGPSWLSLVNNNNTFNLVGTATTSATNNYTVKLKVTDGVLTNYQEFNFTVTPKPIQDGSSVIDFETNDFSQADFRFNENAWTITSTTNGFSTKAAAINNNSTSKFSITKNFSSATEISFDTKVSSEKNYDYLTFYIDDVKVTEWSGNTEWENFTQNITAGSHTLTWEYNKDAYVSLGEDTAWVDNINLGDTDTPVASDIVIDFETNDFSQAEINTNWITTQANNSIVAQSNTTNHNQKSELTLTTNYNEAKTINFDFKVSSEQNYDFLLLTVDGITLEQWSGNIDWTSYSLNISSGNHIIEWIYKKDFSVSSGDDKAWIDNIVITPKTALRTKPKTSNKQTNLIGKLNIYPNPSSVNSTTYLSVSTQTKTTIGITILNSNGQIISNNKHITSKGINNIPMNLKK